MREPLLDIVGLLLAPMLVPQALCVRSTIEVLPEPPGPRFGRVGEGPELRLLVLGDSAAAGVGAAHQDEALLGQLLSRLQGRYTVDYRLLAVSGATTIDLSEWLLRERPWPADLVVTSLGVNEVTRGRRLKTWSSRQRTLVELLRRQFSARHIVLSSVPPMGDFVGIPQPLRWYLGQRARLLDQALKELPHCQVVGVDGCLSPMLAKDGFHPGPDIYRAWAERILTQTGELLC
ncbi:MAG: SGNH/GDSL hydrolase family protein [Vulcanimicrobiota bacterium]